MIRRFAVYTVLALSLCVGTIHAQRQVSQPPIELIVKIGVENDSTMPDQLRLQLTNESGVTIAESFARGENEARFLNVEPGNYRLRAVAPNVEDVSDHVIVITSRETRHIEFIRIRKKQSVQSVTNDAVISAAMLNIPAKALAEFEKGNKALKKQSFDEARERFSKAVEIYPRYAAALNNLGVISMQRGNLDEGKNLFTKAIDVDDRYAPPYLNLAKAHMRRREYREALALLTKAEPLDPSNVEVLALLTMLEYESHQVASALEHARRVHTIPGHENFAFVHFIAGKALESQGQPSEAVLEYKQFLKEAPHSPTAAKSKELIEALEKRAQ